MRGDMSLWNVQGALLHSGDTLVQCILTVLALQFDRRSCTQMMVTHIQNAYNLCTQHTQFLLRLKARSR